MPISGDLVLAEVIAPDFVVGKSVIEGDLRNTRHINVIAVKYASEMDSSGTHKGVFHNLDTKYRFKSGDVLLVTGKESDVFEFSGIPETIEREKEATKMTSFLKTMFNRKKKDIANK